jgi:hypothetical protein
MLRHQARGVFRCLTFSRGLINGAKTIITERSLLRQRSGQEDLRKQFSSLSP